MKKKFIEPEIQCVRITEEVMDLPDISTGVDTGEEW